MEENARLKTELEGQKLYSQALVEKLEGLEMQLRQVATSPPVPLPVSSAETAPGASTELEDLRHRLTEQTRLYAAETIRVTELTSRLEASERARAQAEKDKESILLNSYQPSSAENTTISELTSQLAASEKARAQAEKDREAFLNLYHQSSDYVSTVKDENRELLERAEIAEGQVKHGLAMAKATFQKTLEKLEKDAEHHKRVAEFLIEKDHRTNEEIRFRAAEEPELRMQMGVLQQQLRKLTKEVSEAKEELEDEREERDYEKAVWNKEKRENEEAVAQCKEQMFRITVELNESETKLANVNVAGTGGGMNEMVYRCCWREDGERCKEVWVSKDVGVSFSFSILSSW
jgi:chromosome segregation ATPase